MIAIIHHGMPIVRAYYRMFSGDNAWTGRLSIPPANIVTGRFQTFEGWLNTIHRQAAAGEREFLLAHHGNPKGIPLPLVRGTNVTANHGILDDLRQAVGGDANARSDLLNMRSAGGGQRVFRYEIDLDRLLQAIRNVRALKLRSLHFRSCNIGAGPALAAIHKLLNVGHTEAPRVLFLWARIPTRGIRRPSTEHLQQAIRQLPYPRRVFTRRDCLLPSTTATANDPAMAVGVVVGSNNRPGSLRIEALDNAAIEGWTNCYLSSVVNWACNITPAGGGYRHGVRLPIIGLFDPSSRFPVLFPGDGFTYLNAIATESS